MASFVASPSSSVLVPQDREELRVRVRHSTVPAISDVVHIPPVQPAQASRRVQEWAEHRDCHLRECPPNQLDVRERLRAVQDSVISTGLKKVR